LKAVEKCGLLKWFRCDRAAWRFTFRNINSINTSSIVS